MISPELVKILYDAASMQRWNDYPRMVELSELDKQAHKFIIAWFLAAYEEDIDYHALIEAGIFEFLRRVMVTDIRPDVFRNVIREKEEAINGWVFDLLRQPLAGIEEGHFFQRMRRYFEEPGLYRRERELLSAAHYLATRWEFNIVYDSSRFLSDIEALKSAVEADLASFGNYRGVVEIGLGGDLARLVDLNGRLRFQIRWAQTPRVPKTSVLGHVLIVALFSYFYSLRVEAGRERTVHNFFCALFHDLPEALTRDIISPVKRSVPGLDELIVEYEIQLIEEKILPLVPERVQGDFAYLLGLYEKEGKIRKDEFQDRVMEGESIRLVSDPSGYNDDRYRAIDGRALKACDHLAAFTEAILSISYGIRSKELEKGMELKDHYAGKSIGGVDFEKVMMKIDDYFRG